MPFEIYKNNKDELRERFKKELSETVESSLKKKGIIAKADSLGSLEALLTLLKEANIPIIKVGIGSINKSDITSAKANLDINELDAVIVGFNVLISEDAEKITGNIKIITDEVIYKLIENLVKFRGEKAKEIEKKRLMELSAICKLKILPRYVFRNSNPAIFGVKIDGGKLRSEIIFIDERGNKVGKIKKIQSENKSVGEAFENQEVAISIPGVNFERRLKDIEVLYSDLSEKQFKNFKKNKDLLSQSEIKVLQEIAEIKRKEKIGWGA